MLNMVIAKIGEGIRPSASQICISRDQKLPSSLPLKARTLREVVEQRRKTFLGKATAINYKVTCRLVASCTVQGARKHVTWCKESTEFKSHSIVRYLDSSHPSIHSSFECHPPKTKPKARIQTNHRQEAEQNVRNTHKHREESGSNEPEFYPSLSPSPPHVERRI